MKRVISKLFTSLFILTIVIILNTYEIEANNYYDLKFEKLSEKVVRGEYEKIGEDIFLDSDSEMTMEINKSYKSQVDKELTKDEKDAIGQIIGREWNQETRITKEEYINVKGQTNVYIQVRPVYREIKGNIIKDYTSWNKKKEVTIRVPVDLEYKLKAND